MKSLFSQISHIWYLCIKDIASPFNYIPFVQTLKNIVFFSKGMPPSPQGHRGADAAAHQNVPSNLSAAAEVADQGVAQGPAPGPGPQDCVRCLAPRRRRLLRHLRQSGQGLCGL